MQVDSSDALIASFYTAAAGRVPWSGPLDELATRMDLFGAQIFGLDKRTRHAMFSAENGALPPTMVLDYFRYYQLSDPRIDLTLSTSDGQWMHCHEHISDDFVATNPFYQDFVIPCGGRYLSSAKLVEDDAAVFMVHLLRGSGQSPLGKAESATLQLVQYHLSQAMQIFLQMRTGLTDLAVALQLLEQFNHPMLVLDKSQRVSYSNRAAADLLTKQQVLSEKNGLLLCSDKAANESLSAAVRAVLSANHDARQDGRGEIGVASRVPKRRAVKLADSPDGRLLAFVSPLWPMESLDTLGASQSALVILHTPPLSQNQLDPLILAECYDLTPAESRVAVQIANGDTVKKIAERYGLATVTVRTHLSRIMAKAGVTRQADLVRVLSTLPLKQLGLTGD